jgi:glutamine amidotransferase
MLAIVDYGAGNVGSIRNMLRRLGVESTITARPEEVAVADRIILPGVGAFGPAAERLRRTGLADALQQRVRGQGVPFLGICLGMQLMLPESEEGEGAGLGWIAGRVRRFSGVSPSGGPPLKVPHMGWNTVDSAPGDRLLGSNDPYRRFYFVHSYYVDCSDGRDVAGWTVYGDRFVSAVASGNLRGVQFHPEKSHRYGLALLQRFVETSAS